VLARFGPEELSNPEPSIQSAYARALFPAWFADPELASFVPLPRSTSKAGAAVAARIKTSGYDWVRYVRALDRPTLVIYGERDPLPVTTARELVTNLPRALLALIPGAGHLPFLETPNHFFTLVETFLAGL
jgi:pimeloyl-ACP methyl ester carboxylesterase